MNLKLTFLAACIFVAGHTIAQDYKPFNTKGESLFMNAQYDVQAIRIDSVISNGTDTIYKNYLSAVACFSNSRGYCKGSWIGSKVVKKNNGWCYFFNVQGDSIKFNLRAGLNQSWTLYTYPNSSSLKATISAIDYVNFSGISDSVKTISVYQFDNLGNKGALHSEFKISKKNGFIKLNSIYDFPDHTQAYILAGALNPTLNIKNIKAQEIYDFAPGDEYHITSYYYNNDPSPAGSSSSNNQLFEKRKVLQKIITSKGDSVIFMDSVYWSKNILDVQGRVVSNSFGKQVRKDIFILNDARLNTLPLSVVSNYSNYFIPRLLYDTVFKRMQKVVMGPYNLNGTNYTPLLYVRMAYSPYLSPGCHYLEGLGGCYSYKNESVYSPSYSTETYFSLLYFKKGSTTWGVPISKSVLTAISTLKEEFASASLSPNPINTSATLEIKNASNELYIFSLSDLLGNEVMHKEFTADKIEIEKGNLAPGLYVYSLKSQTQTIKMGKVVIQ
jgi:hypothetical protein